MEQPHPSPRNSQVPGLQRNHHLDLLDRRCNRVNGVLNHYYVRTPALWRGIELPEGLHLESLHALKHLACFQACEIRPCGISTLINCASGVAAQQQQQQRQRQQRQQQWQRIACLNCCSNAQPTPDLALVFRSHDTLFHCSSYADLATLPPNHLGEPDTPYTARDFCIHTAGDPP